MIDAVATVSALYGHPRLFDTKAFEKDLEKHLKNFLKANNKDGFSSFSKRLNDPRLLEMIINVLASADLKKILQEIDEAWIRPKQSVAQMRGRIILLARGEAAPESDLKLRAKKQLPKLKSSTSLESLRTVFRELGDPALTKEALILLPSKLAFVRRFDKFYPGLADLSEEQLVAHIEELAASSREPTVKKLNSAAAKAKWSGKEPD